LNSVFAAILHLMSGPGSDLWMMIVSIGAVIFFAYRRRWYSLVSFVLTVPCGALLNEGIKLIVQRHRPYIAGPFVNWHGYSFPSGHTISATLLYGLVAIVAISSLKARHWRVLVAISAALLVLAVAFSRVAL